MTAPKSFIDSLRAINAQHVSRHSDCCDWITPEGIQICHERTYVPWSPFKEMSVEYWSEAVYTDKTKAEKDAAKYKGRVAECFYCDPEAPLWFIIHSDFDAAASLAYELLNAKKQIKGIQQREGKMLNTFEPPRWACPELRKKEGLPVTLEDYLAEHEPEKYTRKDLTHPMFTCLTRKQ